MKKLLFLLTISFSYAQAASVCKMKTGYGTFVGYGASEAVAFEKAAERCYDSLEVVKAKKGKTKDLSEDQSLDFIDYCVNLKCD